MAKTDSPSALIDARIEELGDWRGALLGRIRAIVKRADPEAVEEWKWRGVPVWSHDGILFTGETYKAVVKLTFARGASIADPAKLFNASLEGNTRRAIDFHEGDKVNEKALTALIRAAVALNQSKAKPKAAPKTTTKTMKARTKAPRLLSGGNPQIAKADGDAPVRAYIAALPGWKRSLAERVDALVARTVPGVAKAGKGNSPFYGVEGQGWFLGVHAFNRYLKLTFFRGTSLTPQPPVGSKSGGVRYLHLGEDDAFPRELTAWIEQAARLPGWEPGRE